MHSPASQVAPWSRYLPSSLLKSYLFGSSEHAGAALHVPLASVPSSLVMLNVCS